MAFRASTVLPAVGLVRAKQVALQAKDYMSSRLVQFANATSADMLVSTAADLRRFLDEFQAISSINGLSAYAQAQENDPGYNIVTEFTTMRNAITAVVDSIVSTFPKDAGGFLLEKRFNSDGTVNYNQFTGVQLTSLRNLLTTAIATIS